MHDDDQSFREGDEDEVLHKNSNEERRKKPCRAYILNDRKCKYGKKCMYDHSEKTFKDFNKDCTYFVSSNCKYEEHCLYIHSRSKKEEAKKMLCGRCRGGYGAEEMESQRKEVQRIRRRGCY